MEILKTIPFFITTNPKFSSQQKEQERFEANCLNSTQTPNWKRLFRNYRQTNKQTKLDVDEQNERDQKKKIITLLLDCLFEKKNLVITQIASTKMSSNELK